MYEDIKEKFNDLNNQLADQSVIGDPKKLAEVSRKHSALRGVYGMIIEVEKLGEQIKDNKEILNSEEDGELKQMAEQELSEIEPKYNELIKKIEFDLIPKDPNDIKNCLVEVRAGTGGDESTLFAAEIFKMYSRYAESKGWKLQIMSSAHNEIGGFKEIIFEIHGNGAYGDFKYESGTHRVQRVPETEKQGRVHTSAVTVAVLPEAEEIDIEIRNEDIRIDTFCSSGPGGQSVNTTYSAIRITHIPTGMVVSCQDEKSQHQNKDKAMRILRSRLLAQKEEEQRARDSAERKEQIGTGDRSGKIRTYNFPQDRITDHRINKNWHGMDKILAGDLGSVIDELRAANYRRAESS